MQNPFPGRRFSAARAAIALVVVAALVVAVMAGGRYYRSATQTPPAPWFGGYVDVTSTPSLEFESLMGAAASNVVLSFVVADGSSSGDEGASCVPSWGAVYRLDEAAQQLDLDRRIAEVRLSGRTPVISFGGQRNEELAVACQDADSLADAYAEVVRRYDVSAIDLDLEGRALADPAVRARRAHAIARVQSEAAAGGGRLAVWVTLPADRDGLTNDGVDAVRELLEAGVSVSGVNLMTMDFGVPSTTAAPATLVEQSVTAGYSQVERLLLSAGQVPASSQVWGMLGATVMIGLNDTPEEVFTRADAGQVQAFAAAKGMARLSMWSLNRDRACPSNTSAGAGVSDTCSGVDQDDGAFGAILAGNRMGSADRSMAMPEESGQSAPEPIPSLSAAADDPATSPYAIWDAGTMYAEGTKVVWHRNVYVALWTTRGDQPDLQAGDGRVAWRLVGPVLPGETPRPVPSLPVGTYAEWDADTAYVAGDRVMVDGVPYEARWWTRGDNPLASSSGVDAAPWRILTEDEVRQVLDQGR